MIDARIPVRFGPLDTRRPNEAVLTDGDAVAEPHARIERERAWHSGCACCVPRTQASAALGALFRRRALATGPAFQSVLAVLTPPGEAAVRVALETDPVALARYRLELAEE